MVGNAVATIVWSSAARNIPSMSANRITRILRCSSFVNSCSSGASTAFIKSSVTVILHFGGQGFGKSFERSDKRCQLVARPVGKEPREAVVDRREHSVDSLFAAAGEADALRTLIFRVRHARDVSESLELL